MVAIMEKVVEKYGVKDRAIYVVISGLIEEDVSGLSKIKAIYSYSVDSKDELDRIIQFLIDTWDIDHGEDDDNDEPDLGPLLDGTGIFLN